MDLPQPRHYTVNDFQEWDRRDALVLQPKFQRRMVWKNKARSYLIDSIVRGFPIPPIYIREILDAERRKTVREVVDGQQRLRAVLDFLDGELVILRGHNENIGGKQFSDLSTREKESFFNYPFSVVILVAADDTDVFRTFERLNSNTLTLNAQEKLNAKFFGSFKQFVFKLGQSHLEFWRNTFILTDRKIVRMGEAELTSELVVAMLAGLQDKKKSLEGFYKRYDDEFSEGRRIKKEFESCVLTIQALMGNTLADSPFSKKALFYSLFCVIYDLLYELPQSPTHGPRTKITADHFAAIRRNLARLGAVLRSEAPNPREVKFIEACARQTDNIYPRKIRHRFIMEAIRSAM
jgi:hypothetical protein